MNSDMDPWQLEEWKKCALDFTYFAKHYLLINHPDKGLIPFELYEFQERVLENYEDHKLNIVSKFRQGGLTTLTVLYMMWRCMFKLDQLILVMSKTDREAIKAGRIVTKALQHIKHNHPWLFPELSTNTHHEKNFVGTGSFLEFRTIKAARGQSLSYIIIDEAAFIQGMDDAWKDMYPTVSTGGRVIVISTVNGMGNWYEKTYREAKSKRNTFNVIDIDYTEHPAYRDPEWIKTTKANLSPREWAQEFERNFLGSGNSIFGEEVLTRADKQTRNSYPIKKLFPEWDTETLSDIHEAGNGLVNNEWEKGALWVWEPPIDGHEYIVSVDTAGGVGEDGDNSVFQVIDITTVSQAAEFSSNEIQPHQLAMVIHHMAEAYNTALVVVENNGPGGTVLDKLIHNQAYENIYYQQVRTSERAGIMMNTGVRQQCLDTLQDYLQNDHIKLNSARLVREMKTFVFNRSKKKVEAQKGYHDDTIMSLALGLYVRDRVARDVPLGVALPATLANSHLSSAFEKIRAEIKSINPEDLFAKSDDEKMPWEKDEVMPGVIMPFRRPMEGLLSEFGWMIFLSFWLVNYYYIV